MTLIGFLNIAILALAMVSVTWGVYCEIIEQKGALHNLSTFWLSIFAIFVGIAAIENLARSIWYMVQLGLYLVKSTTILVNTTTISKEHGAAILAYPLSIQLGLMRLVLSLPQWIVTLRTFQALKQKLWYKNKPKQDEHTG